jgi:hypothetical protein
MASLSIKRPIDGPQQLAQFRRRHFFVHRDLKEHAVVFDAQGSTFSLSPGRAHLFLKGLTDPHTILELRLLFVEAEMAVEKLRGFIKSHRFTIR